MADNTTTPGISRELMGKIVDEVFDGAIEDCSVIEEIYAAIKRHEAEEHPTTTAKVAALEKALTKINDIRNSIIGCQTVNWSEHIYPLVAALEEAGIEGAGYPAARANVGTMLDRTLAAENAVIVLRTALGKIANMIDAEDADLDDAIDIAIGALAATEGSEQ